MLSESCTEIGNARCHTYSHCEGETGTHWFTLKNKGSVYQVERHEPPLLSSKDRNFRPVAMTIGPDGAIYVADFYTHIFENVNFSKRHPGRDHSHGRIWRISYQKRAPLKPPQITGRPVAELLDLLKVDPDGPACHTGETSCFFNLLEGLPEDYEVAESGPGILSELYAVIQDRQRELPEGSYTAKLLQEGVGRIAQKVIEEAGETAIAGVQGDQEGLPGEVADLMYHALVLMAAAGVKPQTVWDELRKRRG